MKILIADDERLVRLSLKHMLEELSPNKYTFIEAKNGQELISLSKLHQPDISFIDINMPLLDGLSALKICKKNCPNTEWFILTGEAEFSFAKEAVNIGVRNYLLKPISLDELKSNLEVAENSILNKSLIKNKDFELTILSLINPTIICGDKFIENEITLSKGIYNSIIFFIDTTLSVQEKNTFIKNLRSKINDNITFLLNEGNNYALCTLLTGDICLIIKSNSDKTIFIDKIIDKLDYENLLITPIISKTVSNISQLYYQVIESKKYATLRSILYSGTPLYIDNLENSSEAQDLLSLSKDIFELCNYYLKENKLKFIEISNKISSDKSYKLLFSKVNIKVLNRFLLLNLNHNFNFSSFDDFINFIYSNTDTIFSINNIQSKDTIGKIMDYVNENYMNDIGVNTIANIYGITPNYLSKIFHEKSGMKFSDYITYIRVTHGKNLLLQNKSLTIKDVANKVGYYSARHFTKQFYKLEGYYPSDLTK